MLACDQLRLHGVFEELTNKIKDLPQTLPKMLDYILADLEEIDAGLVTRFMRLLYCLPHGKIYMVRWLEFQGSEYSPVP